MRCIYNISFLYSAYSSTYTSICPSKSVLFLFAFFYISPHNPAAVQCCGSQCFIYHCVHREDIFHPPGHVAVPDRSLSVCWLNYGAWEGRQERFRDKRRNSPQPFSDTVACDFMEMVCLKEKSDISCLKK